MKLKVLVGEGSRIMGLMLPFLAVGIAANILWPSAFHMGSEMSGLAVGIVLLVVGITVWLTSVGQILVFVPRKKLITTGAFAVMAHPIYTSVALLVLPGLGFVVDTWLGPGHSAPLFTL